MTILTPADAARILAVSEYTVTGMLRAGTLPGFRVGRLWRIPLAALEEWVAVGVSSSVEVRDGTEAQSARQRRGHDMVLVMAATGLRVGEAMGLRWEDVEVRPAGTNGPYLTVRHQLARVNGEAVLSVPKSVRSERTIPLAPVAVAALERQRAAQARERFAAKRIGQGWDTGLVFTTEDGRPLSESTVHWVMAEACKRAGIRAVSPHDLRRFASTVIAATGDMKAAQLVLGHTSATLTADVYSSPTDASRARAVGAIEEAMNG